VLLISWPVVGIIGSIIGGAAYGLLQPIFATIEAVEEGKDDKLFHCFVVCFIFMSLECSLFLFILLSFITEISYCFSGWYLEHYTKELHGCPGLERCLLPFLLLGYG
jgi:hypothetical protein